MSDASRIVVRLKKKGLVESKQSEGDRRSTEVIINNQGLNLLKKMDGGIEEFDMFFSNLTPSEAHSLISFLLGQTINPIANSLIGLQPS